jgi:hypothetical protein
MHGAMLSGMETVRKRRERSDRGRESFGVEIACERL